MSGLNGIRGRLAAARVLARRGAVDLRRPDQAVRALLAIRRYGAIGGLVSHTAARYRDAPAITDDYGTVSFGGLEQASNALARGLLAKGVEAGDVIATLQRNSRDVLVTLSAANKIGVRTVLMNTGFAGPQLADVSTREKVSCILADDEFDSILATLPPEILRFTSRRFAELAETQSASSLPAPRQPGGMAILTSGTTGTPKGVPRNRIDPSQSAQLLDRIPWPRDGVYYIAAPLFHATGLATCALGLMLGNHVVMTRRFDPEATLKAIAQHRVGAVVLVPTMLQRILDLGPDVLAKYDTLSLKVLLLPALRCRPTCAAVLTPRSALCSTTCTDPPRWPSPRWPRQTNCVARPALSAVRRWVARWLSSTSVAARSPSPGRSERCLCPVV